MENDLEEYDTCAFTDNSSAKHAALLFDRVFVFRTRNIGESNEENSINVPAELLFSPDIGELTKDNTIADCDRLAANLEFNRNSYAPISWTDIKDSENKQSLLQVLFRSFQEFYKKKAHYTDSSIPRYWIGKCMLRKRCCRCIPCND